MPGTTLKERLKRSATFFENKDGGTAIVMGILAPVLLFGIAFGSEVAGWEMTKRRIQNAADVAAFAAAKQLAAGYSDEIQFKAANYIATQSGFSGGDQKITVTSPPTNAPDVKDPDSSGTISPNGDDQYIHVVLEQPVRRNFSRMFVNVFGTRGSDEVIIRSEAVAYLDDGNAGQACVLSLSKTASGAVEVWGSTTVTLGGCQIAANSNSSSAFKMGGSGIMEADCIHVVGDTDVSKEENMTLNECASPKTGASEVADPYGSVPEPTAPACTNANTYFGGLPKTSGRKKASPGCYSGGYTFNNEKVDLEPGGDNIYYLNGGQWQVNGNAEVVGAGVMLYLYNGATLKLNGGAVFEVSSMPTGTYSGLAVFYSRSTTGTTKINGDSNFNVKGAIYAPSADIEFSGNTGGTSTGECLQVIGNTVKMTGNSDFYTDCSAYGVKTIEVEGGTDSISIVG